METLKSGHGPPTSAAYEVLCTYECCFCVIVVAIGQMSQIIIRLSLRLIVMWTVASVLSIV